MPQPEPPMIATTLPRGMRHVDARAAPDAGGRSRTSRRRARRRSCGVRSRSRQEARREGVGARDARGQRDGDCSRTARRRRNDPRSVIGAVPLSPRAASARRSRAPPAARAARRRRRPRTASPASGRCERAPRRRTPVTSTSPSSSSSASVRPTARGAVGQQHRMQPRLQVLGRVRRVGRAVEEAAEQAVALLADRADAREHAVERHAEQQQRVRREHQAAFEHLGDDLRRAGLEQRGRARCRRRVRTMTGSSGRSCVHVVQDLERDRRVGERDRPPRAPSRGRPRPAPRAGSRRRRRRVAAVGRRLAHALAGRRRARRTGCPRARAGARGSGRCGRSRR